MHDDKKGEFVTLHWGFDVVYGTFSMAGMKFLGMFIPTVASTNSFSVIDSCGMGCENIQETWFTWFIHRGNHQTTGKRKRTNEQREEDQEQEESTKSQ